MAQSAEWCPYCGVMTWDGRSFLLDGEGLETIPDTAPCRCEMVFTARYGIVERDAELEDAVKWIVYRTEKDAHQVRRRLDKEFPAKGPHRVVEVSMTLREVAKKR